MTEIFYGIDFARQLLTGLTWSAELLVLRDIVSAPAVAYAHRILRVAADVGAPVRVEDYPADQAALADRIADAGPVLPLFPQPEWMASCVCGDLLGPERDVEGLHPIHAGALASGQPDRVPPTADAAIRVAEHLAGPLEGRVATVVGASPIVGRPLALRLIAAGATVRIAQSATRDLAAETRDADIVFAAAGVPGLLGREHFRKSAIAVDIGVTRRGNELLGDIDNEAVRGHVAWLTHVPDGIGPVTAACLLRNAARYTQLTAAKAKRA